jgi:hypothetical protein
MKLLFINSSSTDYLQDLTFSGLVKILGPKQVVDYPWNIKYHLPVKRYPKNLGYSKLLLNFHHIDDFNVFDAIILGSAKKDAIDVLQKILPKISKIPIVFLDGGDRPEIGGDFFRLGIEDAYLDLIKIRPFDVILKREYIESLHGNMKNVYPFPFSFPYQINIPATIDKEKKYNVSFWAQQNPEIRKNVLTMLSGKYDCNENGTTLNQDFKTYNRKGKFYLEELSRCKIVLNFRGGGWDTMRYWEVPAVNTFMISQKPQISIPNNFEDGKHLIWCNDGLDDLFDKIDYYLKNDSERIKIAEAGKSHLYKYHLNTHRAEYLIKIIEAI